MSLRAVLVLACLYSAVSHASPNHEYGSKPEDYCVTPTTYAMITPSPDTAPYPITVQGQEITSWVPQYAVCNPDNSDCTTIYSTSTYNWCSTVVPCYPSSCTVTDCAQAITFSHTNSYHLQTAVYSTAGEYMIHGTPTNIPAPTTIYYVEPIVTKYALSYLDYAKNKYEDVGVEKCIEIYPGKAVCEVYVEHWVEEVHEKDAIVVLPVTMHTYCPEPTTITYGTEVIEIVNAPTTYTFVTERTEISTVTETETKTRSSTTSTLTSTVTIVVPDNTGAAKPDVITPYETSYSSKATPKTTAEEYTETTTITTDCPDSTVEPAPSSYTKLSTTSVLAYHAAPIDSTSTETTTKTLTLTPSTEGYSSIALATELYSIYPAVASEYSTPHRRAELNTASNYPTPPKPKNYAYDSHRKVSFAAYKAKHESEHSGEVHTYGEYADESKEDEQRKSGSLVTGHTVKARDEYLAYMHKESGAGKADGQGHSYGQYSDHSEAYKYSSSGAGTGYPKPKPVAVDLEERAEYSYKAAGDGKVSGQAHSYGQYADYSKEYEYSQGGAGTTYPDVTATDVRYTASQELEERDKYPTYSYEAAGSGKASGEAHSYGQYADYSEKYEYGNSGAGARYPIRRSVPVNLSKRDEFSYGAAGSGKASGEVHSYGQYADYSDEYEYNQGKSFKEGRVGGRFKSKESGEYSHEASGERHSYGQYQDYEKEFKHEYENEASSRASKLGENSYSYGVEGKEDELSYY